MVDWFISELPEYVPNTFVQGTDTVIASGLAGVDWSFVLSGVFLIVCIFCFFKILGGVLCRLF